jgi:hypothetical protein
MHARGWLVAGLCVAVFVLVAAQSNSHAPSASSGQLTVGAYSAMERVPLTGAVNTTSTAQISAARGERESFQIVVDAKAGPLEAVNIELPSLRSQDSVIDPSNLAIYKEHYLRVDHSSPDRQGSNRPEGPGFYPDALIPLNAAATVKSHARLAAVRPPLEAGGRRSVYWFDVFVPRGANPGIYRGEILVTAGSQTKMVPVSLTVWHHTLPVRPSLKSSFGVSTTHLHDARFSELLLSHGIMPFLVDPGQANEYETTLGLSTTGLWFFSDSNAKRCTMNGPPSVQQIRDAMAKYPSDLDMYVYAADEIDPCPALFPTVKQWARNVHAAGAKMLVTVSPVQELMDDGSGTGRSAVDIWVLLPEMYSAARAAVQQVLNKGDEVWSYNALVQDTYSPKWEIDFDPINYRIQPGYLSQSLGITGVLYSKIDSWNEDPWSDAISYRIGNYTFPGEDMLAYPGGYAGYDGPLPSMRLKWLQKGVEDYEYVEMLKRAGRGDWALSTIRSVASDWTTWTRSAAALEQVRQMLGEELDRLETAKASNRSLQTRQLN